MRWFGENWGAPICKTTKHAPTPEGLPCAHNCQHSIREGDIGVLIPYTGPPLVHGQYIMAAGIPHIGYHLVCFFDEIGIRGKTHD
jgi:hypothetical protein